MKKTNKIKKIAKYEKIVPDTSVVIERLLSNLIQKKKLVVKKIIIHEAVLAELESQSNKGKEKGLAGLEEIGKIRSLSKKYNFKVEFKGSRPGDFEIKFAKSGEIDSLIRSLAQEENAVLFTADIVQARVAEAKGINVVLHEFSDDLNKLIFEKYFTKGVVNVQIRKNSEVYVKKGTPGNFKLVPYSKEILSNDDVKEIYEDIISNARTKFSDYMEYEKKNVVFIKFEDYNILITKPPLSLVYEMNISKFLTKNKLSDYKLSPKAMKKIINSKGALIMGDLDNGKSTFLQALTIELAKNYVVSTIESPRSFSFMKNVSQYTTNGNTNDLFDVVILTKPNFIVFDELRNTDDFRLFNNFNVSGIKTIGSMNANKITDALHKLFSKYSIKNDQLFIDTIIHIKKGKIFMIYSLETQSSDSVRVFDLANEDKVIDIMDSDGLEIKEKWV